MITDVIIIGGGAAGLCAAVYLKQQKEAVYSYLSGMGSFENHLPENTII